MKVTFEDASFTTSVEEVMKKMGDTCEKEKKNLLKRCGDVLVKAVVAAMKKCGMRSKINRKDYVHMMDDVQSKLKKSKSGDIFLSVSGGKNTGYKWRFLNDGAIDQRGNVTNAANHFMEMAIKDSEQALEEEIDKLLKKVVDSD